MLVVLLVKVSTEVEEEGSWVGVVVVVVVTSMGSTDNRFWEEAEVLGLEDFLELPDRLGGGGSAAEDGFSDLGSGAFGLGLVLGEVSGLSLGLDLGVDSNLGSGSGSGFRWEVATLLLLLLLLGLRGDFELGVLELGEGLVVEEVEVVVLEGSWDLEPSGLSGSTLTTGMVEVEVVGFRAFSGLSEGLLATRPARVAEGGGTTTAAAAFSAVTSFFLTDSFLVGAAAGAFSSGAAAAAGSAAAGASAAAAGFFFTESFFEGAGAGTSPSSSFFCCFSGTGSFFFTESFRFCGSSVAFLT